MTTKKETKKEKDAFNIEEALNNLEMPRMFVDGFKAYIQNNNLKFKSEKGILLERVLYGIVAQK